MTASPAWTTVVAASVHDPEPLVTLFTSVAAAEGWRPGGELRAHIAGSVYFGLYAAQPAEDFEPAGTPPDTLIGGLQLVLPDGSGGLPCRAVWPEVLPEAPGGTAHAAVLALAPGWRGVVDRDGVPAFWHLGVALWRYCVEHGVRELWLEATPRALRCYRRLGWPLVVRGELREHWGEPCFLCSMTVREVAGALAERAVRSPAYARLLALACTAK